MDKNSPQSNQPCRGIIVVDTNGFEPLAASYDAQNVMKGSPLTELAHPTETYLDLLQLLGRRGFRIIIPEMVMKEATSMLVGGDLGSFFVRREHDLYSCEAQARSFIAGADRGAYPGIETVRALGNANYAMYLKNLREAATLKGDPADPTPEHIRRNNAIMHVENSYKELKKDCGELHCFDVIEAEIKNQHKTGRKTPIFFLSADSNARNDLRQRMKDADARVSALTADGIFKALEYDGYNGVMALEALGLSGTGEEHWESIKKHVDNSLNKYHDYYHSRDGYFDSPLASYNTGKFPFAEAVHGMAEEIVKEQKQAAEEAKAVPKRQSPLDRFQARAAKSQQLRSGGK